MNQWQAREHTSVVIRPYEPSDAADTLAVFISAVTETASADYTAGFTVEAEQHPVKAGVELTNYKMGKNCLSVGIAP